MTKDIIKVDVYCGACGGTGLYMGFAEMDGAAVICRSCGGTGCVEIEFEKFQIRKRMRGVKRVFKTNPGVMIYKGKKGDKGQGGDPKRKLEDYGGVSYEDWIEGKKFEPGTEMRRFTCPAWWYQEADYSKKPDWKECISNGAFSNCRNYCNKEKCWERWDKQFRKKTKKGKV